RAISSTTSSAPITARKFFTPSFIPPSPPTPTSRSHGRHRERHLGVLLDRPARRDASANRRDHRGMSRAAFIISLIIVAATVARAADIPLEQRRSDSNYISADTR